MDFQRTIFLKSGIVFYKSTISLKLKVRKMMAFNYPMTLAEICVYVIQGLLICVAEMIMILIL